MGSSGQNFITSDARFKQNVSSSNVAGLDFISKLRPVQYNLQARALDIFRRGGSTKSIEKTDYSKAESMLRTGFIAQEVEQAARETHFNFDGIHVPENDKDFYSISYSSLVVPLVKAVQELNQKVEVLESENARLRGTNTVAPVTKESDVSKGEGNPVLTEQQKTINQLTLVNGTTRAKLAELQQQLDEMKKILEGIKKKD
ncbi:MAG: tail fiber domain-containing protein [Bacteroidetes bacterium]|nr:tail fiber domain-containing protein [Bacteroidota bacterium]